MPTGETFGSRGIGTKSDLEPPMDDLIHDLLGDGYVAPGLEEAISQVLERTQALTSRLSEKTALVKQLSNDVCDLQEIVEYLGCVVIGPVRMLQSVPPGLLGVEPLIFNDPSVPPSVSGYSNHVCKRKIEIGRPLPRAPGCFTPRIRLCFDALKDLECVLSFVGVKCTVSYPPIGIPGLFLRSFPYARTADYGLARHSRPRIAD